MKWMTRERVRIDRVASAWLIRRFIDPEAEFLFVPREAVLTRAAQEGATPFHVKGTPLGQAEGRTGFDQILAAYGLSDPALVRLADIVRGADKPGLPDPPPEAAGLRAISHGVFLMSLADDEALAWQLPVFDALYRACQEQVERGARPAP